jgi:hypothetical protein
LEQAKIKEERQEAANELQKFKDEKSNENTTKIDALNLLYSQK